MYTDEGIVGLGEPILEGRALTCQTAVKELEPWLIGEDPTRVVHLWQAMYKHAFYRGGEILTSALSGVEQALWDIYRQVVGRAGLQLLGGPTRDRIRVYGTAGGRDPESAAASVREAVAQGFNAIKTGVGARAPRAADRDGRATPSGWWRSSPPCARRPARRSTSRSTSTARCRPQTAKRLVKALEPYHPFFIEEPVQCQNVDVLADIARSTSVPDRHRRAALHQVGLPRGAGEAGGVDPPARPLATPAGIMETRLIAGMAEAYYAGIAPHCPLGPIALAACLQLDAAIPNFLCQEGGRHITRATATSRCRSGTRTATCRCRPRPGLGIELDEEALADKIGHDWQNPKSYAEDGAAIDW